MSSLFVEDTCLLLGKWPNEILGVTPCITSASHSTENPLRTDTVIITVQNEGVYIYSLKDLKCLYNWFLSRSFHGSFSFNVISKQVDTLFYNVISEKQTSRQYIMYWDEKIIDLERDATRKLVVDGEEYSKEDPDLSSKNKKRKKIKELSSQCNRIVGMYKFLNKTEEQDRLLYDNILINSQGHVYMNGKNGSYEAEISDVICIWTEGTSYNDLNRIILTLTMNTMKVYYLNIYKETERLVGLELRKPHEHSTITSICYDSITSFISIIWSDGTWFIYKLTKDLYIQLVQGHKLTCFIIPQQKIQVSSLKSFYLHGTFNLSFMSR
jgi:hypothetical protein